MSTITLTLNGERVSAEAEPRTHLADFVREAHLLTGTHIGCEHGVCGACTLFVEGRPVRGCLTLAVSCEDADVRTVEGFADDPLMARIRRAFHEHHALQCGFCTPGMLATAYDICRRLPDADELRVRAEISGNLCRCTGYQGIVRAVMSVLAEGAPAPSVTPLARDRLSGMASAAVEAQPVRPPSAGLAPEQMQSVNLEGAPSITRSLLVDAPLENVWPVLKDPRQIVSCVPGASVDALGDGGAIQGSYKVALGPMGATFSGSGAMTVDDAARTGRVIGEGRDRLSGTRLNGALDFAAVAEGGATRITLEARYRLSGALAQFGRPAIVEAVADRVLDDAVATLGEKARGEVVTASTASGAARGGALFGAVLRRVFAGLLGRRS